MSTFTLKRDAEIQRDVLDELGWDTRVAATDVGVEVHEGVVTLTGTVSSYAKKLAAQEAAHRVAGVRDVANDLDVRIPGTAGHTDSEIAHAVRHALLWDALIPEDRIQTTVSHGWVTLTGTVDRWSQREDAGLVVQRVRGVCGVTNEIEVTPAYVDPARVRTAVEDALVRRAEREAERITVMVHDGVVTVAGRVRSWSEKRAVLGAAGHAPGVREIRDDLRIEPVP